MKTYQKYLYAISWITPALIKLVLAVVGLLTVWIALQFDTWPRVLWIWGNDEGIPKTWAGRQWHWLAIRNPVNNLRYLLTDHAAQIATTFDDGTEAIGKFNIEPTNLINNDIKSAARWTWWGPFAGYRRVWLGPEYVDLGDGVRFKTYSEIWIGWKIGSGVPGLGFTAQFRFKRDIGT